MVNILRILLVAGLVLITGCGVKPDDRGLQALLDDAINEGIPGLSVAIANNDGLIWTGVAGKADIIENIPVKEDHLFGVGSITKTFIAVVILQLVEEERISIDQTPLDILGADVVGGVPGADKATIAQLLNHTSGIPSWEDDPKWIKEGRGEDLNVSRVWGKADTLSYITNTPLTNEAGDKYSYANTNHTLLGLIIEKITGNDATDEIQQRILNPIGIEDIYLEGFEPLPRSRLATRYHYATPEFKETAGVNEKFPKVTAALIDASTSNLSVEWTAGGMVATARDLAKYVAAFRAGKLLKPESMAFVKSWFPISQARSIGHGLFLRKTNQGYSLLGHSGSVLGYTGAIYWFESQDISVAVVANVGTMHIGQRLPNAASFANSEAFIEEVLLYARGDIESP